MAAPSFLNGLFLPSLAASSPTHRMRGIELPPALVRAYAAENIFDLALTLGREQFPDTWVTSEIGDIRKRLFGSPTLARQLGRAPITSDRLAGIPFVVPIYNHYGQFVIANEGCPLGNARQLGHEVSTVALGLELAARTEHLVFAPVIVAGTHVQRGELVEIAVRGWDVREQLFVVCNGERMLARDRNVVVETMRTRLAELAAGAA